MRSWKLSKKSEDVTPILHSMMEKQIERRGNISVQEKNILSHLNATAFFDGSLTFVLMYSLVMGKSYWGWAKFNPTDRIYNEDAGVYKALSNAVSHLYVDRDFLDTVSKSEKSNVQQEQQADIQAFQHPV